MAEWAQVEHETEVQGRQNAAMDQQVGELKALLRLQGEELAHDEQHARAMEARLRDSITSKECFLEGAMRASVTEVEAASVEAKRCKTIRAGLQDDVDAARRTAEELCADLAALRLEATHLESERENAENESAAL